MILWPDFYLGPPQQVVKNKVMKSVREWMQTFGYVVVFYAACTNILLEPYQIPSGSMMPTLIGDTHILKGDRVIALKWISSWWPIKRGDIVIFISVEDQKTFIVKRVVGLPGDKIEIKPPHVWVNGKPLLDPPVFKEREYVIPYQAWGKHLYGISSPFIVPKGSYFVMGDNSHSSNDSRFWGHLPKRNILGKAELVFWPLDHGTILR